MTVGPRPRPWGHLYRSTYRAKGSVCPGKIYHGEGDRWRCSWLTPFGRECGQEGSGPETGHLELRQSALWTLKYAHGGKTFYASTRTADWNKAQQYRKKRWLEAAGGGAAPWEKGTEITLGGILDLVLAHYEKNRMRSSGRQEQARRRILEFKGFLGGQLAAADVTEALVNDEYVLFRQGQRAANGTINRELAMIRHGMRLACARRDRSGRRLLEYLPQIATLAEAPPRAVTIDQPEYEAIVAQLRHGSPDIADLVEFYRLTGWRNTEVRLLEWTDVNWFNHTVRLRSVITKSGAAFELPFREDPDLEALLKRRRRLADDVGRATGRRVRWVFFRRGRAGRIGKRTSKASGGRISTFQKDWDAALRAAGLPDSGPEKKHVHDFRRTVASETLEAGADPLTACELVGWKTTAMLKRYRIGSRRVSEAAVKGRAVLRAKQSEDLRLLHFPATSDTMTARAEGGDGSPLL